jgi:hypothetical protein
MSAKLTPEICINNASSNSRLRAAGRQATAADSHCKNCLYTLFFSHPPLMRKQLNYTCMLKNLLQLYCIWTWDTRWFIFFFFCLCAVLFYFMHPLWWDNYRTTTEVPSLALEAETDTKIIKTEISLHLNLEGFFFLLLLILFFFILFIYIYFLSFTYVLFLFLPLFFFFFIFNPLSVSLMPFQLTVD